MGFSPQQIAAMSLWQYYAASAGWKRANSPSPGPAFPTLAEHTANVERAQTLH